MPEESEQVEAASTEAADPVLQGQCADAEVFRDRRRAFALPQPAHGVHHHLDAGHLTRKGVAGKDPFPVVAPQADRQRNRADCERRDRVKLAPHTAPGQARARR